MTGLQDANKYNVELWPVDHELLLAARETLSASADIMTVALTKSSGLSPTRAWQRLNLLLDSRQAWCHYPSTVTALRARRGAAGRSRS